MGVGLLRYERPIMLRRVDCESRPPVPASADKRLAREIELRGYPVLALGERVPEGPVLHERRSSAKTTAVEPSGKWAGADTVVVRVAENGVVFHIELRYPDGFDLSPIVEQMVAEFGSEYDRPWISSYYWNNRTTTMLVDTSKSRPRFLILDRRF